MKGFGKMDERCIEIEGRKIGVCEPPVVIAEIGINHNGSLKVAKEMVDAAHRAGAEIVKHQTHIVEDEMSFAARSVIPGNANVSIYEIMAQAALSEEDEYELMQYVKSKGMIFISTPFSRAAADRLHGFGVSAFKIGSGEANHYPLIEHIAGFGKPMIVSTGMNDIASIKKTVGILQRHKVQYALLHTTNIYPTVPGQVRLGAMMQMHDAFPDVPFGLSDHTQNNHACLAAAALGASILERHFTDRMDRTGPDIVCSMDEEQLKQLICGTKEIALMRGGVKKALPEEQVTIDFAFATVVSIKDIKKGDVLTLENIWAKRPGTGEIRAEKLYDLIGKKAAVNISADTSLDYGMVENR